MKLRVDIILARLSEMFASRPTGPYRGGFSSRGAVFSPQPHLVPSCSSTSLSAGTQQTRTFPSLSRVIPPTGRSQDGTCPRLITQRPPSRQSLTRSAPSVGSPALRWSEDVEEKDQGAPRGVPNPGSWGQGKQCFACSALSEQVMI